MNQILDTLNKTIINDINLIITDINNNITFASNGILTLSGYTEYELLGMNPSIMKHNSTKFIFDDIWYSLNTDHKWNGILKNVKKNGEIFYVNAEIYKDFDLTGMHIGYHAIHTDITESIKNPHKFIFDNELFNLFFSDNDELLTICLCKSENNEQKILEISHKLSELIGKSKDEIIKNNLSFTDIISPKSKYYKNQELLVSDYERKKEIIIRIDTIYGLKKCRLSLTPFLFQGYNAKIFKLIDVTNELNYSSELEEIKESKNNFLASFSHEIRTPLNATLGFLTLLQLKETDFEKLNYIRIIMESSTHLLDLMNDVIDFTSIDNKKLEIHPREFTPKDIQSTIEIFYAKCLEKNIELAVYISPLLPEIMKQDVLRIKQVISNLISNAIKFVTIGGKITIDIDYFDDKLQFMITDNGLGMTKDQLKKIFKPFVQATNDTKLIYGGTGLGLSVVHEIIKLMDGDINVETALHEGTTFTIKFPIEIIKHKTISGLVAINDIIIFTNFMTDNTRTFLVKYLKHFTNAIITITDSIDILSSANNKTIFLLHDILSPTIIDTISENNKIVIIKHMNDITFNNINTNILELTLPIIGSNLFDILNSIKHGISLKTNNVNELLNLYISGKILIADDLESNRLLLYEALSHYDLELDIVDNGKEALSLYKKSITHNKSSYNLVILDMNMPILSGFRASAKIRDFESKLNIDRTPIVALTANRYYTSNDANKNLVHMDEYLSKPINLKQLLSTIIKYTMNIPVNIEEHNTNKISILKEIRDNFLKGDKSFNTLINGSKNIFTIDENKILGHLTTIKFNKRKFNVEYNKLMKMLRKNNQ